MVAKYSTDDSTNTIEDLPIFAEARRNWHAKQNRSATSSTSISFIIDERTTPQQGHENQDCDETSSTVSEEYPYDH